MKGLYFKLSLVSEMEENPSKLYLDFMQAEVTVAFPKTVVLTKNRLLQNNPDRSKTQKQAGYKRGTVPTM